MHENIFVVRQMHISKRNPDAKSFGELAIAFLVASEVVSFLADTVNGEWGRRRSIVAGKQSDVRSKYPKESYQKPYYEPQPIVLE